MACSANTQGVLEPCGCQSGQGGGLARRAAVLPSLRSGEREVVLLDAGNLVATLAPNRDVLDEALRLLRRMGYAGGALGPAELGLGAQALRERAGRRDLPLALTNVRTAAGEAIGQESAVAPAGGVKLALFAVISPSLVPKDYICRDPEEALAGPVRAASARGRIPVLISYQPLAELRALLKALPEIRLALVNSAEVAGQTAERCGGAWIVPVPGSGRQLHVIRVEMAAGDITQVSWEPVELPASIVPDPKITAEIREFSQRHRLPGYTGRPLLSAKARARAQTFMKAAARECGTCHEVQQHHWAESKHAHAWVTLREAGAQQRTECVGCHTTPLLVASLGSSASGVGCATCHGEGSQHAAQPRTPGLIRRLPDEKVCLSCHTSDASSHFEYRKYVQLVRH